MASGTTWSSRPLGAPPSKRGAFFYPFGRFLSCTRTILSFFSFLWLGRYNTNFVPITWTTSLRVRGASSSAASRGESREFSSTFRRAREGKSYTADTLAALHAEYPGAELWLLMGTDMFLTPPSAGPDAPPPPRCPGYDAPAFPAPWSRSRPAAQGCPGASKKYPPGAGLAERSRGYN